jgi:xylulokinase
VVANPAPLYLGLDSSTQSLGAVILEADGDSRRVVFETSLAFDEALPRYGTRHGVLPSADPSVARSSPVMWADALDLMFGRLSESGLDLRRLAAISGSAQQHGSVYVNAGASTCLASLDPRRPTGEQVASMLARAEAPIWMDSSTSAECGEIEAAVGGASVLAQRTGSRAFERFTGPQIRRFANVDPAGYAATGRIHLVSSFLASLLAGKHSPLDPGDASGMNLMDLGTQGWWAPAVEATAPGLAGRLPAIAPAWTVVGPLSAYWQARHGLPPLRVVIWSGDNPCSLIGVGLVREGRVAISLGTSDTIFGLMNEPRVSADGTGHVFGAPTGAFMGLTCFSNGSLARERVRDTYGLDWEGFSRALAATPPGNEGRMMVPWFVPEITPPVLQPTTHTVGLVPTDGPGHVRALVEGQMMSMALYSRWMGVSIGTIHATGGAAVNPQILRVIADVFDAEVRRSPVGNSAALGAALRAFHADRLGSGQPIGWDEVIAGVAEAGEVAARPDPASRPIYRNLLRTYEGVLRRALGSQPR